MSFRTRAAGLVAAGAAALALISGPATVEAADASCKQLFKIKSKSSTTATTLTFVNEAKTYRAILWLGFDGHPKDFGNLAAGQRKQVKTFLTHPWMVATGPGDCLAIVMPQAGNAVVRMAEKTTRVEAAGKSPAPGEEGGRAKGCPPGTVPVPETDNCVPAPSGKQGSGNPVSGRSLGGIVRSGPSQDSARVASLKENQPITILRNSGVTMNGYAWFQIRAGSVRGYQWGGILCADAAMPGVYQVCK